VIQIILSRNQIKSFRIKAPNHHCSLALRQLAAQQFYLDIYNDLEHASYCFNSLRTKVKSFDVIALPLSSTPAEGARRIHLRIPTVGARRIHLRTPAAGPCCIPPQNPVGDHHTHLHILGEGRQIPEGPRIRRTAEPCSRPVIKPLSERRVLPQLISVGSVKTKMGLG